MFRRILTLTIVVAIGLAIGQEAEADWLSGWDKRIKLTIDHNDITSSLSNFPILIHLSNSSGRNSDDVSCVFDELTNNTNRKKIAVAKSNGTTQCYVEIEKWDDAKEQAWLWVKVSGIGSIRSTSDTVLYLYYDKNQADNTTYVDDTNIGNSYKVWDDGGNNYFKGVWHLKENAAGTGTADLYKDSTSNNNDGNDYVSATGKSGKIGDAQQFDGSNDYVGLTNTDYLVLREATWTIATWIYSNDWTDADTVHDIFYESRTGSIDTCILDFRIYTGVLSLWMADADGPPSIWIKGNTALKNANWYHAVAVRTASNNWRIYLNGVEDGSVTSSVSFSPLAAFRETNIGRYNWNSAGRYFNGIIDEVRISNTARSAAWIKASYESGRDHLLDFGSEEEAPKNAIFFGINF